MKTLYIMRHTRKQSDTLAKDDFDIKLSESGIEDAKKIAKKLYDIKVNPDLIVSSPANRTKMTSEIIAAELNYHKNIMYNEVLYQAYVNEIFETITYTFDTVNSMFLIGHNPSITALTITLNVYRNEIQPGEVLKIEFDVDSWINIDKDNARLIWLETP